jgi:hypothetical protein
VAQALANDEVRNMTTGWLTLIFHNGKTTKSGMCKYVFDEEQHNYIVLILFAAIEKNT